MAQKKEYTHLQIAAMLWNVYTNVSAKGDSRICKETSRMKVLGSAYDPRNEALNSPAVKGVIRQLFENIKNNPNMKRVVIATMANDMCKGAYKVPYTPSDRTKAGTTRYVLEKLARFYDSTHKEQPIVCIQKRKDTQQAACTRRASLILTR